VSALAASLYVKESGFSNLASMRPVAWTHVAFVVAAQTLFLFFWGWVAGGSWAGRSRIPARLFACSLVLAAAVLNLSYAAQAASLHIWGSPLTSPIRHTMWPQIRSYAATVGIAPYLALGCVALLFAGVLGLALWQSRRLWALLQWAVPSKGFFPGRLRLATAGTVCLLLAIFVAILARKSPGRDDIAGAIQNDPVFLPWFGSVAGLASAPGDLAPEVAARRDYPVVTGLRKRNVIVVIVDCLRADHLPMYGYQRDTAPFLKELADAGRLQQVENAFSVSNASKNGILGILSSKYPERLHIGNFILPDVLKMQGYTTRIIASGDHTVFQSLRAFYGNHIDFFVDGLSAGRFPVNDDRNVIFNIEQLPASDGTPLFLYVHLMSAHSVGVRQPEALRWPSSDGPKWTARFGPAMLFRQAAIDNYDNGVFQADLYLRRIFALLEAKGYLHDYVAVLAGDHGQSLGEHGIFGHGRSLWQSEVRIPMFFMESGDFRYGSIPIASQVDIAPTLLGRLGLPTPSSWQGRSLLAPSPETLLFLTSTPPGTWRGLVEASGGHLYKYVFDDSDRRNFQEKLFDLTADPGETNELTAAAPQGLLARLRSTAAEHFQTPLPP
jgi:glucan phosphoethanolaminetransferase (alkaline phosphatase superfamily)